MSERPSDQSRPVIEEAERGTSERPPLFVIAGPATAQEVAALSVVLTALAVDPSDAAPPRPRSLWASPQRAVRPQVRSGPGGWRASSRPG